MIIKYYMRFLAIVIMVYLFLPVVFQRIEIPYVGYYTFFTLWFISIALFSPHIFLNNVMVPIYLYAIIYIIMDMLGIYQLNIKWLRAILLPITFSILMLYYFIDNKDIKGLSMVSKFAIICIIITCITSLIGLQKYPNATRFLIGPESQQEAEYYSKLGIGSYGFFSGLSYTLPALIYITKYYVNKFLNRFFMFLVILLICISIFQAAIAVPILISFLAIILSLSGSKNITQTRILFILIVSLYIIIPNRTIANVFYQISRYSSNTSTQVRMYDVGLAFETGVNLQNPETGVESRLSRAPIALEAFVESPFIGNRGVDPATGHLFWLYSLALFGLIGFIPLIYVIYYEIKTIYKIIRPSYKFYYILCSLLYILLGFMKNLEANQIIFYMFFLIPGINFIQYSDYETK